MYFYVGRRRMLRPQLFCCPLPYSGAGLQIGSSFFCPEGAKKVWRSDDVSGDDFFEKKRKMHLQSKPILPKSGFFAHQCKLKNI